VLTSPTKPQAPTMNTNRPTQHNGMMNNEEVETVESIDTQAVGETTRGRGVRYRAYPAVLR
jgi:hypothetical protein